MVRHAKLGRKWTTVRGRAKLAFSTRVSVMDKSEFRTWMKGKYLYDSMGPSNYERATPRLIPRTDWAKERVYDFNEILAVKADKPIRWGYRSKYGFNVGNYDAKGRSIYRYPHWKVKFWKGRFYVTKKSRSKW